jgi:hypothetical protein
MELLTVGGTEDETSAAPAVAGELHAALRRFDLARSESRWGWAQAASQKYPAVRT